MNKEDIKRNFQDGDVPTEREFAAWIDHCVISVDRLTELPVAEETQAGSCYLVGGDSLFRCEQVEQQWQWVLKSQQGQTAYSYLALTNKPRLNNVVISGEKSLSEFGIMPDFNNLTATFSLKDSDKIPIGTDGSKARYITLRQLQTFLTSQVQLIGNISDRKVIAIEGSQNEINCSFYTKKPFVLGTSALYLNGQRLSPDIDYQEIDSLNFKFLSLAPKDSDRILFEAVVVETIAE